MKISRVVKLDVQRFLQWVVDWRVFVAKVSLIHRIEGFAGEYRGREEIELGAFVFADLRIRFAIPLNFERIMSEVSNDLERSSCAVAELPNCACACVRLDLHVSLDNVADLEFRCSIFRECVIMAFNVGKSSFLDQYLHNGCSEFRIVGNVA